MRLFVGIELPADLKQSILDFQSELRAIGVRGAWKAQDNFHITLEFLGEIEPDRVLILRDVLRKTADRRSPFQLRIGGLGAFSSWKKPHTLWMAVKGDESALQSLRDDLHGELKKEGFALEERQFRPHISLVSRPELGEKDFSALREKDLGEWAVRELILFESKVIRGRRLYLDLIRAGLSEAGGRSSD